MSIKERIKRFCSEMNIHITDFEKSINASNGYVNSISKGIGEEKRFLILEKYPNLSIEWLLTGKGEMFKSGKAVTNAQNPVANVSEEGIPLVEIEAVGGFGSGDFAIKQTDILGRYIIPDFDQASFMIRVRGDSMSPRYSSGDLVACRVLRESQFIQWNEVHVIATREQGILIKRLRKGSSNKTLLAVSENPDYAPFEIPQSEITGIALVLGGVRLE